jgi:hypothetical protein
MEFNSFQTAADSSGRGARSNMTKDLPWQRGFSLTKVPSSYLKSHALRRIGNLHFPQQEVLVSKFLSNRLATACGVHHTCGVCHSKLGSDYHEENSKTCTALRRTARSIYIAVYLVYKSYNRLNNLSAISRSNLSRSNNLIYTMCTFWCNLP